MIIHGIEGQHNEGYQTYADDESDKVMTMRMSKTQENHIQRQNTSTGKSHYQFN